MAGLAADGQSACAVGGAIKEAGVDMDTHCTFGCMIVLKYWASGGKL